MINYSAPDLTQHPPRSLRVRLGGYVHLARLLDKARAEAGGHQIAGTLGRVLDARMGEQDCFLLVDIEEADLIGSGGRRGDQSRLA